MLISDLSYLEVVSTEATDVVGGGVDIDNTNTVTSTNTNTNINGSFTPGVIKVPVYQYKNGKGCYRKCVSKKHKKSSC